MTSRNLTPHCSVFTNQVPDCGIYQSTLYNLSVQFQLKRNNIMSQPPSNKKLIITFVYSTVAALLVAILLHYVSTHYPAASKLMPNCKTAKPSGFSSFEEFYPFYLCEHSLPVTKLFHFIVTFNVLVFLLNLLNAKATSTKLRIFVFALVQAYSLAWISHFFLEQNKPATFKYPIYSFMADWVMFKDALKGHVSLF